MTVVTCRTTLSSPFCSPSVDGDEDIRRVGDDVEHRRPLLRLGNQRLDVIRARIGANVEVDADAIKAVANVVIHAEDALDIHVTLEGGLDRVKLDAAALGD